MTERQSLRFDFNWKITLFVVIFFPLLIKLGFWQLDRAEEKRMILDRWEMDQADTVITVDALSDEMANTINFRRFQMAGKFLPEQFWLQENKVFNGDLGYQVIMLFQLDNGQYIAVDRGWVQGSPLRDFVPQVDTPEGHMIISGTLVVPSDSKLVREAEISVKGWPHKILEVDLKVMRYQVQQDLFPKLLKIDADSAGSLDVDWSPTQSTPHRNTGYAVQWFLLAFALVVLYVFASTNIGEWFTKKESHERE